MDSRISTAMHFRSSTWEFVDFPEEEDPWTFEDLETIEARWG